MGPTVHRGPPMGNWPDMRRRVGMVGAAIVAAGTLVGLAVRAAPTAGAAATAQSVYNAAIAFAGSENVHYVSKAQQQGAVIEVIGDSGRTSGSSVLVVQSGETLEEFEVLQIGTTGYLRGNAAALTKILGLTATQSTTYTNTWLSFPTNNATLSSLVSGLSNAGVADELKMSGPYTFGGTKKIGGRTAQAIDGVAASSSGGTIPIVLYVQTGGTPRPLEELTGANAGTSADLQGSVVFSHWGEKNHPKAPTKSVSLISLAPAG
jgi:hypothetical protein